MEENTRNPAIASIVFFSAIATITLPLTLFCLSFVGIAVVEFLYQKTSRKDITDQYYNFNISSSAKSKVTTAIKLLTKFSGFSSRLGKARNLIVGACVIYSILEGCLFLASYFHDEVTDPTCLYKAGLREGFLLRRLCLGTLSTSFFSLWSLMNILLFVWFTVKWAIVMIALRRVCNFPWRCKLGFLPVSTCPLSGEEAAIRCPSCRCFVSEDYFVEKRHLRGVRNDAQVNFIARPTYSRCAGCALAFEGLIVHGTIVTPMFILAVIGLYFVDSEGFWAYFFSNVSLSGTLLILEYVIFFGFCVVNPTWNASDAADLTNYQNLTNKPRKSTGAQLKRSNSELLTKRAAIYSPPSLFESNFEESKPLGETKENHV